MRLLVFVALLSSAACGKKAADDGRSPAQRETARRTDAAAKKGALRPSADPAVDLEKQRRNLERLRENERGAREAGNRIAAWTARHDAHKVEKQIAEDERLIRQRDVEERR
jgi:hypothetical protein